MSRRSAVLAGIAAFLLTLSLRLLNSSTAFAGGAPQIPPLDEIYHLKRMTFSAAHFPAVLELDPDRGPRGAFCPWPPLYDLAAGGVARLFGATTAGEVLSVVVWIPPLFTAFFVALFTAVVWTRAPLAAFAAASALALSPCLVKGGWIGSIDHHFLEGPLVVAILGAVLFAVRSGDELHAGLGLAAAMTAAMLVQTAMLVACGLAFVVAFGARRYRATAIAFGILCAVVTAYHATRAPGFPDNAWFLGRPHIALFAGAAVAAVVAWRLRAESIRAMAIALAIGTLTTLLIPGAASGIAHGTTFFGNDTWLGRIVEFQPVWRVRGRQLGNLLGCFSSGAALVWLLAVRTIRRRETTGIAIALFAVVYFLLALTSARFMVIAVPLLAIAGAALAQSLLRDGLRVGAVLVALLVAAPPLVHLVSELRQGIPDPVAGMREPLQVARYLREHNRNRERVLTYWSWGHAIGVAGDSPVILDNFGWMPDADTFRRAHEVLLTTDENELARYCAETGVRYLALPHPAAGLPATAALIGARMNNMQATWWWRATIPAPRPTRWFTPVFANREGTVVVWRFRGGAPR